MVKLWVKVLRSDRGRRDLIVVSCGGILLRHLEWFDAKPDRVKRAVRQQHEA
jgi:hypothetical protein